MAFMSSVGDALNKITKWAAGEGNGISSIMRTSEKELAQNLANSKLVSEFNGFGFKANQDITLAAAGKNPELIFKKGDTVHIRTVSELQQLQKQGFQAKPVALNAEAEAAAIKKYGDLMESYSAFQQNGASSLSDSNLRAMYNRGDKGGIGYHNLAKGYFGDEINGGKRVGTVLGAGAATAVGGRYLSGGNATTNNTGERDIVGIPFI